MYRNMSPKQSGISSSWNNFFVGTVQGNRRPLKTESYAEVPRKWRECENAWLDDSQWHYAVYEHLHVRLVATSSEGAWKSWYVPHL